MSPQEPFRGRGPHPRSGNSSAKPTVRQVYALARVLLKMADERWPETRAAASDLIERLRTEESHAA